MATLKEVFTNIANAIRQKNGSTNTITPAEMPGLISSIETGIDTSDATATAEDILKGETAYANGKKLIGTLEKGITLKTYNFREMPTLMTPTGVEPYIEFFCYGIKSTSTLVNFTAWINYTYNGNDHSAIFGGPDDVGYILMSGTAAFGYFTQLRTDCTIIDNYIRVPARYLIPSSGDLSYVEITENVIFCVNWYDK